MRNKIYCLLLLSPSLLKSNFVLAQANVAPETFMRSNDKIYVVAAICVTILTGLFLYVAGIDKRIGRIEKEQTNNENL